MAGGRGAARAPWLLSRGVPLRAYMVGLVALFVVVAGVNVAYQRQAALRDARNAALAAGRFAVGTTAQQIAAGLGLARAQVTALAANPQIRRAVGNLDLAGCTLQFGGAGPFGSGHLDIIASDGAVGCSSLAAPKAPGYAGARWLAAALRAPLITGPVADARTGQQAEIVAAPVPGKGAVAAVLDLAPVGPALAATLAGWRHLEIVVTTADGAAVLTRSIDPAAWPGKPVAGTPFAGADRQAEHRDLNGTPRLYAQARVAGVRWQVFAGDSIAQAFAAANQETSHQLVVTLIGLAVLLLAALVLYRRIARPIARLRTGVRTATSHLPAAPITVAGPEEVLALTEDFNHLIAAANRELEARTRLAAVAESSADAIVGVTLDGIVTSWNAGAEQMLGYSREEMIGNGIAVLAPTGREEEPAAILERVRAGERIEEVEVQRLRKDNAIIDLSYTISPIRDDSGTVTGAATVARDVTGRNRAEADRHALEHRLHQSERLESLGQLAGGIAHDFNNLLAAIMNYAGFVAEQTTDRPAVQADAEQIQAAAERGARLTRQLLVFSRHDATSPEPLDVNAIVADITNLLTRTIGTHITLDIIPGAGLPAIHADRGQFEQVLLNLAINARDAMPGGGTLTIQTTQTDLDDSYARTHPGATPGRYVHLTVSDTGTGMSADVAARIFEPFFTTKPEGQGTGLGLSTVYGIITQAGGTMTVDTEEGTGTAFHLYLPATSTPASTQPDHAVPLPRGKGETILVVDDEPAMLAATARILREHGYTTLEAATYQEALRLAATNHVQLLLTDSIMPGMAGPTLAERLTQSQPGLPVLYMTGYHTPGGRGDGRTINKPFTSQTLLQAIHTAISTKVNGPQ